MFMCLAGNQRSPILGILVLLAMVNMRPVVAGSVSGGDAPTPQEQSRYGELISDFHLTHQDIATLKSLLSIPSRYFISKDNIKSITLGAPIFTANSVFNYGSIFDGGALNKSGLVVDLAGDAKAKSEVQVTANTKESFSTDQVKGSGQVAAQFGGFRSNAGYLHESAEQKTSLTGTITANAYQSTTQQIELRVSTGDTPIEMSAYLRGTPLDAAVLPKYVTAEQLSVPGCLAFCDTYLKVSVKAIYDGKGSDNPRAHVEALQKLESYFDQLSTQASKFASNGEVYASTLSDMRALKNCISQSITAFYDKYGDGFTSKLYGYSLVRASATLIKNETAGSNETNNAITIGTGYGNFAGGVQADVNVSWYGKDAFKANKNSLHVIAEAEPINEVNLSSWEDKVQKALTQVNPTVTAPSDVVTKQGVPSLPEPKELRYDPSMPPGVTLTKMDDLKAVEGAYAGRYKGLKEKWFNKDRANVNQQIVDNVQNNQPPVPAPRPSSVGLLEQISQQERLSSLRQRPNAVGGGAVHASLWSSGRWAGIFDDPLSKSADSLGLKMMSMKSLLSSNAANAKLSSHEKRIQQEIRRLSIDGLKEYRAEHPTSKLTSAQVQTILKNQVSSKAPPPSQTTDNANQFIGLTGSAISGFEVEKYAEHLAVLTPTLKVPGDPDGLESFEGFPILYDFALIVHNYEILDTYLNFISKFEISGLKNQSLASNYRKFFSGDKATGYRGFSDSANDLIVTALATGKDLEESELSAFLEDQIFGSKDPGTTGDYTSSKLYKLLGSDGFNYVLSLLDMVITRDNKLIGTSIPGNSEVRTSRFAVISRAPGGYVPVRVDADGIPSFVSHTKANKSVSGGILGGEWVINTETIPLQSGFDIAGPYSNRNQSPLFPVYTYNGANPTTLLFMQFAASTVVVFGKNYSLLPNMTQCGDDPDCGSLTAIQGLMPTTSGSQVYKDMRQGDNGFVDADLNYQYSLVYPDSTSSANISTALANNALLVALNPKEVQTPESVNQGKDGYDMAPSTTVLNAFKAQGPLEMAKTEDALPTDELNRPQVPKLTKVDMRSAQNVGNAWGYMVLLPIDSKRLTGARASLLFTYANETSAANVFGLRADGADGFLGGMARAMVHN